MINSKKLNKLIHEPKQYFIDGHKNRKKRWLKGLNKYRPFFVKNLHHVDKLHEVNLPIASYYITIHKILAGMKYQKGADEAIKKAINLKPSAKNYYQLGLFLKSEKLWWRSVEAFAKSIELSTKPNAKLYREYAYVLEEMNRFEDAANAWKHADKIKTLSSYQYYRYGYTLEKSEQTEAMKTAYKKAIKLDEKNDSQELSIGIFHEKRGFWDQARKAYAKSINTNTTNAELYYKLGLANDRCYDWQTAENAFRDALLLDTTKAHYFYRLGFVCERQEKWHDAATVYQHALDRQENFTPYWFYRLGFVLTKQGRHEEASKAFLDTRVIQDAHGVLETSYHKNKNLRKSVNYTEYYERFELEENTILYESYHGASLSCNPYAIFKALLTDKRFAKYKHIWVVNEKEKIPSDYKKQFNIIFIARESDAYMRYLAKAKYLINNVTFPEYFIRKDHQIYLNTWHGTPIKSLGKDIKDGFMAHKNVARNFLQASHLIQPNSYTTDILLDRYDVRKCLSAVVAEIGYPRQDLMLTISDNEKISLLKKLNTPENKKVVLYAPTWRGEHGSARFDTKQLESDLASISALKEIHLLFRGHHMIEGYLADADIKVTIVPASIDSNSLLSTVDILITDYSSIAFDFLALERPIIYYAYDREEYEKERGFYFPLENLGGSLCTTQQALISSLRKAIVSPDVNDKQAQLKNKFCPHDDGKASKRIIDLLFFNKTKQLNIIDKGNKKSLLFYGGPFIPNGITTSFINLLNHIDTTKYNISIALEPVGLKNYPERMEQLDKVNDVNIIGRCGRMLTTLEEQWNMNRFGSQNQLPSPEMTKYYLTSHKREFKRLFGESTFSSIINFEGYNIFWLALFASTNNKSQKTNAYLHSNMYGEWKTRFPYLEKNFRLYNNCDSLISVSEQTMQKNKEQLSDLFEIDKNKFQYCDNIQNPEYILSKASEELEVPSDKHIFNSGKVFINIARLSPEKDQAKLIKAFQQVVQQHPEAKLINLGSGPLEHHLHDLVNKLKLQENIFFLGQRSNPYPYLKKSDCFILSSNHEGQPMTLFEAMILEKPIIATDIVGNRSVLEGRPGILVDNSKNGLTQGMIDFICGRQLESNSFDSIQYNFNALSMFENKVLN